MHLQIMYVILQYTKFLNNHEGNTVAICINGALVNVQSHVTVYKFSSCFNADY